MLGRSAGWFSRWRWFVLAGWALLILAALPLATNVTHNLSAGGFSNPSSRAVWADAQAAHLHPVAPSASSMLIQHASRAQVQAWVHTARVPRGDVHALPHHHGWVIIPQGRVTPAQMARLTRLARDEGATASRVGNAEVGRKVVADAKATLSRSFPLAIPLLVVLLLVVFGSVASAALPLIVAAVGSVLALGVLDVIENYITLSAYLTDIVSFLALGVGVDYALFISIRFRQELEQQPGAVDDAVRTAMASAGRSVLYSGMAVGLAMASLVLGGNAYWRGIALGGAVAVFSVLFATHTLLPAVLRLAGTGINWGRLPWRAKAGFWDRVAGFVSRHPIWALAIGLVVLGTPAAWGTHLKIRSPANLSLMLPLHDPLREAAAVQEHVLGPGSLAPLLVVMQLPGTVTQAATWTVVARVSAHLARLPNVQSVGTPVQGPLTPPLIAQFLQHPQTAPPSVGRTLRNFINPRRDPHLVVLYVTPAKGPDAPQTLALVAAIDHGLPRWTPPGSHTGVGGVTALLHSFNTLTRSQLPSMLLAVAAVAFLVLLAATGSLWQPLLGVLFDGLIALATAGLLVLTVQRGSLGFQPMPPDSAITPLIFVLLFGLSMDYEVILLHRIQEFSRTGVSVAEASRRGLNSTGGMITGAGMIMVVVFLSLLISPLEIMQTLAVGMSAAIVLDTWVVRTLLVPSAITLLRRWAFWPWGTGRTPTS